MAELPDEALNQLTENLKRLTETMDIHSAVLIKTTGSEKEFESILKKINGNLGETNRLVEAENKRRAYQDAYRDTAVRESVNAVKGFTTALRDGTGGIEKYNSAIKSGYEGISDYALSFGTKAGNFASLFAKGIGLVTTELNEYTGAIVKAYKTLTPLGLASDLTSKQLGELALKSGFAADQFPIFTKGILESSDSLRAIGGTATEGIKNFGAFSAAGKKYAQQLNYMGTTTEEFLQFQTQYLNLQVKSGKVLGNTADSAAQLGEASYDAYLNLRKVAEITGVSIDKQIKAQEVVSQQINLQVRNNLKTTEATQLEEKARVLAAAGNTIEADRLNNEAKRIKADVAAREEIGKFAVANLSAKNALGVMEALASENVNVLTKNNVQLQLMFGSMGGLNKVLQDAIKNGYNQSQMQVIFAKAIGDTEKKLGAFAGFGEQGAGVLNQFGIMGEEAVLRGKIAADIERKGFAATLAEAKQKELNAVTSQETRNKEAESLATLATKATDLGMGLDAARQAAERFAKLTYDQQRAGASPLVGAGLGIVGGVAGTVGSLFALRKLINLGSELPGTGGIVGPGSVGPGPVSAPGGISGGAGGLMKGAGRYLGTIGRALPFVGSGLSALDMVSNISQGNYKSAAMDALGIGLGFIPGGGLLRTGLKVGGQMMALGGAGLLANNNNASPQKVQEAVERQDKNEKQNNELTTQSNYYLEKMWKLQTLELAELQKISGYAQIQVGIASGRVKPVEEVGTAERGSTFTGPDGRTYADIEPGSRFTRPDSTQKTFTSTTAGTTEVPSTGYVPGELRSTDVGTRTTTVRGRRPKPVNPQRAADLARMETANAADTNNPGNIRYNEWVANTLGAIGQTRSGFAVFPTLEAGIKAADKNLTSSNYQNLSLAAAINKWAPAGDNNDPDTYAKNVGSWAKLDMSKKYADLNSQQKQAFLAAMFRMEGNPVSNMPALAMGGRITGPTTALLGEGKKDELVIPLDKNSMLDKLSKTPASSENTIINNNTQMESAFRDMITSIHGLREEMGRIQTETNNKLDTSNRYLKDFLHLKRA